MARRRGWRVAVAIQSRRGRWIAAAAFHLGSLGAGPWSRLCYHLACRRRADCRRKAHDLHRTRAHDAGPRVSSHAPRNYWLTLAVQTKHVGHSATCRMTADRPLSAQPARSCARKSTTTVRSLPPPMAMYGASRATAMPTCGRATARWWRTCSSHAGYGDVTKRRSSTSALRDVTDDGYLLHKYTPSWHARQSAGIRWMDAQGDSQLPIQEDETALVVYALWQHYSIFPRGRVHPPTLPSAGARPRATSWSAIREPYHQAAMRRHGICGKSAAASIRARSQPVYAGLGSGGATSLRPSARTQIRRLAYTPRRRAEITGRRRRQYLWQRRRLGASCA